MNRWSRWSLLVVGISTVPALDSPFFVDDAAAPYPRSTVIESIRFDFSTHRRLAPGSDNWPLTWGADGHLYTSWGDGGGFSGTNDRCRVSLGFGRIEGPARGFTGTGIWGDSTCAPHTARFGGKTQTMLSVGGTLYTWRSPGSNLQGLNYQKLYRSTDQARTWEDTGVEWTYSAHRIGLFAFLQFGRDYAGARDEYVYVYASGLREYSWESQRPGEIFLIRISKERLEDIAAYEFYRGSSADGLPLWGEFGERAPIFRDANGVMRNAAIHVPGIGRYLLVTNHSRDEAGNVAIFDAPEPWGPWTTVLYARRWPGTGDVPPTTFSANFSPSWWADEGRRFVFVFTGRGENDSFNSVEGTFRMAPSETATP